MRIYAPVRRLDSVKESTGTIFEEDRGRGVGLTPPDKLLASSGLNDSGDGAEKEKEPAPTKVEAAIRTPGGAPYDSSVSNAMLLGGGVKVHFMFVLFGWKWKKI